VSVAHITQTLWKNVKKRKTGELRRLDSTHPPGCPTEERCAQTSLSRERRRRSGKVRNK